jgi:hypothetical protein
MNKLKISMKTQQSKTLITNTVDGKQIHRRVMERAVTMVFYLILQLKVTRF